jgi:hypothetical protein
MERSLVLRRCLYGNDRCAAPNRPRHHAPPSPPPLGAEVSSALLRACSEEAIHACKLVVDTCNGLATAYLTQGV